MATGKRLRVALGYLFLAGIVAVGLGVGIVRLMNGMGATTNLSDDYPWGLWIVFDLFFCPFSAGAFMISAVTHIYNRKEYQPIARPVILAGFLGELFVVVILLMDLGRWQQFYNVLLPWYWNLHSFMFQVSICLTLYIGVLLMEVAPAILERLNWQRPLRLVRPLTILIAGAGIVLSALHQSALGSLFLLMPLKLHPLWWTPLLPLLFFTSAAFGGIAMAILVAIVSFRAFRRRLELGLHVNLASILSILLGIYLVLKLEDLLLVGEMKLIFSEGRLSLIFLAEMVIGVIIPLVLFAKRRVKRSEAGLLWGAICVLVGLALNRTNVALLALAVPAAATYFPHWMEFFVAIAAIAAGLLLFALATRLLPVMPDDGRRATAIEWSGRRRWTVAVSGLILLSLTIAPVLLLQPLAQAKTPASEASLTASTETYALVQSVSCRDCHLDQTALALAGAKGDELARLTIEPASYLNPHGRLGCVTCHQGTGDTEDAEAAHVGLIADPSLGHRQGCLSCHPELPDEFPQDRLRTPHNEVIHGPDTAVSCSDCHGGVGHGFDPVSGDVICPMSICLDCHLSRQLDSEFSDCYICHLGPHDVVTLECGACHRSTERWQEVDRADHSVDLVGKHAEAQCFDCHVRPNFSGLRYICSACHQRAHDFGSENCTECHSPAADWKTARLGEEHPFPQDHNGTSGTCTLCHPGGDLNTYSCETCHKLSGMQQVHEAAGLKEITDRCLLCHPQGQKP